MRITIENSHLSVTVDTLGAQLLSIRSAGGTEYLWQGDPRYWADRAPVLFPFIGRLAGETYRWNGRTYAMGIHGFAAQSEFTPVSHTDGAVTLRLSSSAATRQCYPFAFAFDLTYCLDGSCLKIRQQVTNAGEAVMPFALGGHPGFRVPLEEGEAFTDYCLEFSAPCRPDRIGFTSDTVLVSGRTEPFPLENGSVLPLGHSLFDDDAIILQNMARQVTLKGPRHRVTVSCPQMPYLGFWHWPKTDAPYVCIEPWTSLPGRAGVTEDIACRSDFVHLSPGGTYENAWDITFEEEMI